MKQKLKESFLWSVISKILPLYHGVKRFLLSIKKNGLISAVAGIGRLTNRLPWVRKAKGRRFLKEILLGEQERERQRTESRALQEAHPGEGTISVLVPLYQTPERYLRAMIESVLAQTDENWQLCLADGSDLEALCMEYAGKDPRICYRKLSENLGISGNTNACIDMATGEYLALFDHDDLLHPSALYECRKALLAGETDLVYTDEMTFRGDHLWDIETKHYKPDFAPENLRGVNYICHLTVFRRSLLEKTGAFRRAYDGSQDHDLILRLTSAARHVAHIPKILYFWRVHPGSVSMGIEAKSYAIDAGRRAIRDHEGELGRNAAVFSTYICATHYRLDYELTEHPLVSVVIIDEEVKPDSGRMNGSEGDSAEDFEEKNAGGSHLEKGTEHLLTQIADLTAYDRYEVIVANNPSEAAKEVRGDYVVVLHAGMEITHEDWITLLLMYVMQPDVGLCSGRILDRTGKVLEAGYVTGLGDGKNLIPIGKGLFYDDLGYMGNMYYAHNVNAVSLYGTMMKRETWVMLAFDEGGGFRSGSCLGAVVSASVRKADQRIVLNPYAIFVSAEGAETITGDTMDGTEKEDGRLTPETLAVLTPDPYYNPNLSRDGAWKDPAGTKR